MARLGPRLKALFLPAPTILLVAASLIVVRWTVGGQAQTRLDHLLPGLYPAVEHRLSAASARLAWRAPADATSPRLEEQPLAAVTPRQAPHVASLADIARHDSARPRATPRSPTIGRGPAVDAGAAVDAARRDDAPAVPDAAGFPHRYRFRALDRAPVQATAAHAPREVAVIIPRTDNGAPENDLLRPNPLLVATSSHHRLPALGFVFVALCSGLLAWKLSPRLVRIATALAFIRRRLTRDVEAVPATDVARETPRPSSSDRDGVEGVLVAAPATAPTTSIGTTGWNYGTVDGVPRTDLFMSVVAHELKNLMTPLIGSAQMLRSHRRLAPEQREVLLATILSQAERMDRLVTDLLGVSRIESGRFVIEPRPTDLVALANMIVRERQATTTKHQIALKAPPHLDGTWDPDRLAQVLTNLIDNAIKYSPHGGTVTVEIEDQGERALVRVTDQGLGLRPDHIPLLFQPYARLAREQGIRGIGLGLYIARAIIEAHGGRIWASSPGEGFGTTFAFTLPVRR